MVKIVNLSWQKLTQIMVIYLHFFRRSKPSTLTKLILLIPGMIILDNFSDIKVIEASFDYCNKAIIKRETENQYYKKLVPSSIIEKMPIKP